MATKKSSNQSGMGYEYYLSKLRQEKKESHGRAIMLILQVLGNYGGEYKLLDLPVSTGFDVVEVATLIKIMIDLELVTLDAVLESSSEAKVKLTMMGEKLLSINESQKILA